MTKRSISIIFVALLTAAGLFGARVAYSTIFWSIDYGREWDLTLAARPAHLTQDDLWSQYNLGFCRERHGVAGAPDIDCPHNGETGLFGTCLGKTTGNVTMTGWNWVQLGAYYDAASLTNYYAAIYIAPGPTWPAVLPTGCGGGACPQWPDSLDCSANGDNPAGLDNWLGNTASARIWLDDSTDPNWTSNPRTTVVLATGKTVTMVKDTENDKIGAARFVHDLPAGNYTTGTVLAKKSNGTNWPEVKCNIAENGATGDTVEYQVGQFAAAGAGGYCTINGVNSPLTVVRQ